jgi:hypothetical protein
VGKASRKLKRGSLIISADCRLPTPDCQIPRWADESFLTVLLDGIAYGMVLFIISVG